MLYNIILSANNHISTIFRFAFETCKICEGQSCNGESIGNESFQMILSRLNEFYSNVHNLSRNISYAKSS